MNLYFILVPKLVAVVVPCMYWGVID